MIEYVLYFFIAYSCGVISLGMLAVAYLKTREETLAYYGYFQVMLTAFIVMQVWLGYVADLAQHERGRLSDVIENLMYANEFIVSYLAVFAFIVFCLHFFSVPKIACHAAISGGILLLENLALHLVVFVWSNSLFSAIVVFLNDHIGSMAMIYILSIGITRYKTIISSVERAAVRRFLVFGMIALPAMFIEALLEETTESSLSYYPLIYMGETILLTHYFVKRALFSSNTGAMMPRLETDMIQLPEKGLEKMRTPIIPEKDVFERYGLSPRERELILLVLQGRNNSEIAETLFISVSTVKSHLSNIYEKFGVKNRYELITFVANQSTSISTSSEIDASNR